MTRLLAVPPLKLPMVVPEKLTLEPDTPIWFVPVPWLLIERTSPLW